MFKSKDIIKNISPVFVTVVAGVSVVALSGSAAKAQSYLADFSQTDTTSFEFNNGGSNSHFSVFGAAFDFNYNGTVYHTTMDVKSGVSGPATIDPVSGDTGTGTVSENLSNISLQFVDDTTNTAILSLSSGTGILYGLLDDPTDALSNISSVGLSTLTGNWSSNLISIDPAYPSSITMGGITPSGPVSLQEDGHISSFTTTAGAVTGGFQARPVPEAGTLLSLGGMVLSSGAAATRRAIAVRRSNRRTPAAN